MTGSGEPQARGSSSQPNPSHGQNSTSQRKGSFMDKMKSIFGVGDSSKHSSVQQHVSSPSVNVTVPPLALSGVGAGPANNSNKLSTRPLSPGRVRLEDLERTDEPIASPRGNARSDRPHSPAGQGAQTAPHPPPPPPAPQSSQQLPFAQSPRYTSRTTTPATEKNNNSVVVQRPRLPSMLPSPPPNSRSTYEHDDEDGRVPHFPSPPSASEHREGSNYSRKSPRRSHAMTRALVPDTQRNQRTEFHREAAAAPNVDDGRLLLNRLVPLGVGECTRMDNRDIIRQTGYDFSSTTSPLPSLTLTCWMSCQESDASPWSVVFRKGFQHERSLSCLYRPMYRKVCVVVGPVRLESRGTLRTALWTHVAIAFDAKRSRLELFIDGVFDSGVDLPGGLPPTVGPLFVGAIPWEGTRYDKHLAAVKHMQLFPRVLHERDLKECLNRLTAPSHKREVSHMVKAFNSSMENSQRIRDRFTSHPEVSPKEPAHGINGADLVEDIVGETSMPLLPSGSPTRGYRRGRDAEGSSFALERSIDNSRSAMIDDVEGRYRGRATSPSRKSTTSSPRRRADPSYLEASNVQSVYTRSPQRDRAAFGLNGSGSDRSPPRSPNLTQISAISPDDVEGLASPMTNRIDKQQWEEQQNLRSKTYKAREKERALNMERARQREEDIHGIEASGYRESPRRRSPNRRSSSPHASMSYASQSHHNERVLAISHAGVHPQSYTPMNSALAEGLHQQPQSKRAQDPREEAWLSVEGRFQGLETNADEQEAGCIPKYCQFCGLNRRSVVFFPCRHCLACDKCAMELTELGSGRCPYCQAEIKRTLKTEVPPLLGGNIMVCRDCDYDPIDCVSVPCLHMYCCKQCARHHHRRFGTCFHCNMDSTGIIEINMTT